MVGVVNQQRPIRLRQFVWLQELKRVGRSLAAEGNEWFREFADLVV